MLAIFMTASVLPGGILTGFAAGAPAGIDLGIANCDSNAAPQAGEPLLTQVQGSGCVISYVDGFIYGLAVAITSLDGYAIVANGYQLAYIQTANGFGTGTAVNVTKDGVTFERYTIVIFGDANGDGNIDSIDAGTLVDVENYLEIWDPVDDAAYLKASDINRDNSWDSLDAGIIVDYENYMVGINQTTGLSYSSMIFFDSAGGTAIVPLTGKPGDAVVAPDNPTKTGYSFNGWVPELPATFSVKSSTVTAQWITNQSTIYFNSDGGSAVNSITQDYATVIIPPENPVRAGYSFTGWQPAVPATMPATAVTCVAQWTIIYYSITFDANGGIGGQTPSVAYGVMPTPPNVKKLGYALEGWSPEIVPATGTTTYTAQWLPYTYVAGDVIDFGTYPQSKVTDTALIDLLEAEELQTDNTVAYNGAKYKRAYFSEYITLEGGTSTDPNETRQDENGYYINTAYWFKFEPVEWRVLSNTNGVLLAMALSIVDSKAYNNQYNADMTWETSTMRSWVNDSFYNTAFESNEKLKIQTSLVINEDNADYETLGGNNTSDKVFLLSQSEAANTNYGFNANYNNPDSTREAAGTDFAKCSGLYVSDSAGYEGNCVWWLRSPGSYQHYAGNIDVDGYGGRSDTAVSTYIGVRPLLRVDANPS